MVNRRSDTDCTDPHKAIYGYKWRTSTRTKTSRTTKTVRATRPARTRRNLRSLSLFSCAPRTEFDEDDAATGLPLAPAAPAAPAASATAPARSTPAAGTAGSQALQPKKTAQYEVVGTVDVAPVKKHFIAPTTNAERTLHALKAVRRAALLKTVQLQPVSFTLYDAAPQTAYELMRREMKLRTKAAQTRDDDAEAATQTEEVENDEQKCQVPDDLSAQSKRALNDASESARTASALSANTARLNRFLSSASGVLEALCAENALTSSGGTGGFGPKSELPVATRSATFALPPPLDARPPVDISFAPDAGSVLVAYGMHQGELPRGKKREDVTLRRAAVGGGLLAVWVVHQPSEPWQLLRALGRPTCCVLAAAPFRVALCGTDDGSVQVDKSSIHPATHLYLYTYTYTCTYTHLLRAGGGSLLSRALRHRRWLSFYIYTNIYTYIHIYICIYIYIYIYTDRYRYI